MFRLPRCVRTFTGRRENGPNCWNATLMFFGSAGKRFTSAVEMDEWLNIYTEYVHPGRERLGDIMVIRYSGSGPYGNSTLKHTAVLVGDDVYWHKRGYFYEWGFITRKDVEEMYPGRVTHRRIKKEYR